MSEGIATLLPAASVLGIGAVTPRGRDLAEIASGLGRDHIAAQDNRTALSLSPGNTGGGEEKSERLPGATPDRRHGLEARATNDLLFNPALAKRLRRADRFVRMAVAAALDAWDRSRPACIDVPMEKIGLIVTSGLGPHCRGFRFLDGLLDCGDAAASPTDFSHSVHGAAAAYITELLELRGPTISATDFEFGFESAVLLAQCWLADNSCDRVLVGAVEEIGDVMLYCASRMLDGRANVPIGEGSVFFMVGPANMHGTVQLNATGPRQKVDPLALDMRGDRFPFGLSASASAFVLLAELLETGETDAAAKSRRPSAFSLVKPNRQP